MKFAVFYRVTNFIRSETIADYEAYEDVFVCNDTNDMWVARVNKDLNREFEKEEGVFLLERNKIDKCRVVERLAETGTIKPVRVFNKLTINEALNSVPDKEVVKATLWLDSDDGFENWDTYQADNIEEIYELLDNGYGLKTLGAEKYVIVINGIAESGKDTVCDIVKKWYKVRNISSIDLVKDLAGRIGWDGVKDERGRKLLSDLKQALTKYSDAPMEDCLAKVKVFLASEDEILFVHIREPEEINRFIGKVPAISILVKRRQVEKQWNNSSDDRVSDYDYDYVIENNGSLQELEDTTLAVFKEIERMRPQSHRLQPMG